MLAELRRDVAQRARIFGLRQHHGHALRGPVAQQRDVRVVPRRTDRVHAHDRARTLLGRQQRQVLRELCACAVLAVGLTASSRSTMMQSAPESSAFAKRSRVAGTNSRLRA